MYIQWGWQWDEWKMRWVWNWLRGVWKLGHLVWNTMLRVRNACAWYEMKCTAWNKNSFHKVWNFCIRVWKKFSRYEKKFKGMKKKFKVWNCFWGYEKVPFGYEKNPIFAKKNFHTVITPPDSRIVTPLSFTLFSQRLLEVQKFDSERYHQSSHPHWDLVRIHKSRPLSPFHPHLITSS